SMLLGRSAMVPGSTRTVIGLVTPSTVIDGQTVYGVSRRAMAWLLAPISTQAESPSAASGGQATWRLNVELHGTSPSDTVSVSDAVPGTVQLKVGFCAVALLNVPYADAQLYDSGCGAASGSCEALNRAIVLPTGGLALTASIVGQTLIVPVIRT